MTALTVGKLRAICQGMLDRLEGLDDDTEIRTSANTYRMGPHIMETDAGFIVWDNLRIVGEINDDLEGEY